MSYGPYDRTQQPAGCSPPPLGFVALNADWDCDPRPSVLWASVLLSPSGTFRQQGLVSGGLAGTAGCYRPCRVARQTISGADRVERATCLACLGSVIGRPLVALTSHLARGWPLSWHDRVRPAYSEVTLAQLCCSRQGDGSVPRSIVEGRTTALGLPNLFTGWPATVAVLVASYLYGTRCCDRLRPQCASYRDQKPPLAGKRQGLSAAVPAVDETAAIV